jgi:hypothetical protein
VNEMIRFFENKPKEAKYDFCCYVFMPMDTFNSLRKQIFSIFIYKMPKEALKVLHTMRREISREFACAFGTTFCTTLNKFTMKKKI